MSTAPRPPTGLGRLRTAQWPMVVGLMVLWVLLWGTVSLANVLTGLLAGLVVCAAFPLPPMETLVRFHPLGIVRFAARFVLDMIVSSWRLTRYILGPGKPPCAVLAVRMRSPSDLMLTGTSVAVSAVPGSNVLDVHRVTGVVFIHVLGAGNEEEFRRARYEVLRLEERVVRAFGTSRDIVALESHGMEEEGRWS